MAIGLFAARLKLRENDKLRDRRRRQHSTSDLLDRQLRRVHLYDDLVREIQRTAARRDPKLAAKRSPEEDKRRKEEMDARKSEIEFAVSTYEGRWSPTERGDAAKIWASMLKNAIKRRKPDFNESYYGFRVFGNLLDEAQARGLLEVGRDESQAPSLRAAFRRCAARRKPAELAVLDLAVVDESSGCERATSIRLPRNAATRGCVGRSQASLAAATTNAAVRRGRR